jgi:hypothetical protein
MIPNTKRWNLGNKGLGLSLSIGMQYKVPWGLKLKSKKRCPNPNLGLMTKARACEGAGQEWTPGVTFHAPRNVGECEGMNLHTPKWAPTLGVGLPMDSQWTPESSKSDYRGQNPLNWRHLNASPVTKHKKYYKGGRCWVSPSPSRGESCEFVFARGSFVHQKCSSYALINFDALPTLWRTQMGIPNRRQRKSKELGHTPWLATFWRSRRGVCWSSGMGLGRIDKLQLLTWTCTKPTQSG